MKAGAPWSVKGVDPEAREAAKAAAHAAGMSLGAWLNAMIEQSAKARPPALVAAPAAAELTPRPQIARRSGQSDELLTAIVAQLGESERRITGAMAPLQDTIVALQDRIEDLDAELAGLRERLNQFELEGPEFQRPADTAPASTQARPQPAPPAVGSPQTPAPPPTPQPTTSSKPARAAEPPPLPPPPRPADPPPRQQEPLAAPEDDPFAGSYAGRPPQEHDEPELRYAPPPQPRSWTLALAFAGIVAVAAIAGLGWWAVSEFDLFGRGAVPPRPVAAAPRVAEPAPAPAPPAPAGGAVSTRPDSSPLAARTAEAPIPGAAANGATAANDPLRELREAARNGAPQAQYELGLALFEGREVARDLQEASRWFERAAKQNVAPAQFILGTMFEQGVGVPEAGEMALFWYQLAAEQNFVRAMFNLGGMYSQGRGIPQDYVQAAKWFERAGQCGLPNALFNLGVIAERGLATGGRGDDRAAYRWYTLAARQGDRQAIGKRTEVASRLPTQEVAAVDRDTALWSPRQCGTEPRAASPATAAPPPAAPVTGAVPTAPVTVLEREAVAEAQRLLQRLGFDPGATDGLVGERTRRAIAEFQRSRRLAADGVPTRTLLTELRQAASAR